MLFRKKQEEIIDAPLIQLVDIHKTYQMGNEEVKANDGVDLVIEKGEFIAIVGKSGSGKSTVMNIIGALDVPTSGQYILKGKDVSKLRDDELAVIRNKTIGFIFQQYNLLGKSRLLENVELPLLYSGLGRRDRKKAAMNALKRVGLEDKWRNYPNQLSGGQQQRGAVARALAGNPSLILADEPTGALDSKTSEELLGFLKELNEEGNTIILITHDRSVAERANRIVTMQDGKILFDGNVNEYRKQVAL
jgi:putative ABC transport system ATP-binding protein